MSNWHVEYPARCLNPQVTSLFTKDGWYKAYCHNCKKLVAPSHADIGPALPDMQIPPGSFYFILPKTLRRKAFVKFTTG